MQDLANKNVNKGIVPLVIELKEDKFEEVHKWC